MSKEWRSSRHLYGEKKAIENFEKAVRWICQNSYLGHKITSIPDQNGGTSLVVSGKAKAPVEVFYCLFSLDSLTNSKKNVIEEALTTAMTSTGKLSDWTLCMPLTFGAQEHEWWNVFKTDMERRYNIGIDVWDGKSLVNTLYGFGLYQQCFGDKELIDKEKSHKQGTDNILNLRVRCLILAAEGEKLCSQGKIHKGMEAFDKALQFAPTASLKNQISSRKIYHHHFHQGEFHKKKMQFAKALDHYIMAEKASKTTEVSKNRKEMSLMVKVERYHIEANQSFKEGKYKQARKYYMILCRMSPKSIQFKSQLERCEKLIASEQLQKEADKTFDPKKLNDVPYILSHRKELEACLEKYRQALKYDEDNKQLRNELGARLKAKGEFAKAADKRKRVVSFIGLGFFLIAIILGILSAFSVM